MSESPYTLHRLQAVEASESFPPGRYVIRNEKRDRIAGEVNLDSEASVSELREIIAEEVDNPVQRPED